MRQTLTKFKSQVLILVLTIAALAVGQAAWAMSTFTVSSPQNNNTFRITRTGNTAVSETIDWRVVSLSAIAGVHFTGYQGNYSGTVTFAPGDPYKDVTISESTPGNNAYKYQNGTTRSYRFEVLDKDGSILASKDRTMTTGTSVPSSGLFNEKEITIYTSEVQYSDAGYDQSNNPHYIESSAYYNLTGIAPKAYYTLIGAQLRSTISLDAKEKNNGYQYIQVLINNTSTCDNRTDCSNGDPGNINLSRYMAGFDHEPSSANTNYATYTFPVTSQPNNCSEVSNAWSNGVTNKLYTQKFNTNCRATDGRLILPLDFNTLVVRFNASGGGTDHDEWLAKNVKAHIQAVDGTAPTVLNNYKVSGGRHQKGNVIYVTVPFSEIVVVTGTPTLNTSWGVFNYYEGSGSNVLTFRGEISSTADGTLYASGIGTSAGISAVRDLAGNNFTPFTHDFGISLDSDYAWTTADFISLGANTYEIASKTDLRHLALLVNKAKNPCTGLTFSQTQDITCDNTYTPIGYYVSGSDRARFQGTYDGQGFTVSGITVTRTGDTNADGYVGLFGYVYRNNPSDFGTVKNVILANSTFTGCDAVGGIVGNNFGGIVQNCRVESTVTIKAGNNTAYNHGGIVGSNSSAKILGCYSAATVSKNGKSNCIHYGGIVGYNHGGTVKDCLYAGTTVTSENKKGAIVGFDEDNDGVFSNNYYTSISLGGVGADGSSSDQDGARRARTVTLGENIALVGDETAYNVSGLTAIGSGNYALSYNDGNTTTLYSGEGQTLTLSYTGVVPLGYQVTYSATAGTIDGNTLTMPASDVTVSSEFTVKDFALDGHSGDSEADAYIIYNKDQLDMLASRVNSGTTYYNKFIKLGADITYDGTENNYTAIGGYYSNSYKYFYGTFDGDGHTISGININSNNDYQGLFGYVSDGTVKNVTLTNSTITGHRSIGGIVGILYDGNVQNCRVESTFTIGTDADYAISHGGIVGMADGSATVSGCFSAATVTNSGKNDCKYYGGIVGDVNNFHVTIRNCLALSATVGGVSGYMGAIVGYKYNGFTLANNYYYNCTVSGATTNIGTNEGDQDGARQARTVTLGENIALVGDETAYDLSGLTAIGTTALSYNDGNTTTLYSGEGQTLTLSYTGEVPVGCQPIYSTTAGTIDGNTLTMPAGDVTVSNMFSTTVSYINAEGHADSHEAIVINAKAISIDGDNRGNIGIDNTETWYAVVSDYTFSGSDRLVVHGTVNLILADGATFTVNGNTTGIYLEAINLNNYSKLNIFGQSAGTGTLNASHSIDNGSSAGIRCNGPLTINGGTVNATGINQAGIFTGYTAGSLTINGGTVNATSTGTGDGIGTAYGIPIIITGGTVNAIGGSAYDASWGISNESGSVTITGGNVTAIGKGAGISAGTGITLGWTTPSDCIYASSYDAGEGVVSIQNGKTLTDGTNDYSNTLSDEQIAAIAGKTLFVDYTDGHSGDSEADAYMIYNKVQLDALASRVNSGTNYQNKFIKLGADITYPHSTDWDDASSTENNYSAIGIYDGTNFRNFQGSFDGDGHSVSGIRIYKNGDNYINYNQGLFGRLGSNGSVKNVSLSNARITGNSYIAGIVGYASSNTNISNCHVASNVNLQANNNNSKYFGGITGDHNGLVSDCTSAVTISIASGIASTLEYFGGIAGESDNKGTVSNCVAIGAVIPNANYRGAIVGQNRGALANNYYYNCSVNGNTTNIGTSYASYSTYDITANNGAVKASSVLSDSETVPSSLSGKVVFRREFKGGKASTVIFPFAHEKGTEGTYYTFGGVQYDGKWKATMNEYTSATLAANTPYLFVPAGSEAHAPVLFHGTADYDAAGTTDVTDWSFVGVYAAKTWTAGDVGNDYGFAATSGKATDGVTDVNAGDFVKLASGAWIRPMRAYLTYTGTGNPWADTDAPAHRVATEEMPQSISVILVSANGETTELKTTDFSDYTDSDAWYTLDGRKLDKQPTQKGLYIHEGRKVVIK